MTAFETVLQGVEKALWDEVEKLEHVLPETNIPYRKILEHRIKVTAEAAYAIQELLLLAK